MVAFIAMPLGWPVTDQAYGVVPPVAAMACTAEYAVPTVAVDGLNAVLVIESVATADTVKLKAEELVPPGLTTVPFADVSLNSTRKKLRCQWCDFDGVSEAVKAVYESQYLFAFFPAVEAVRA